MIGDRIKKREFGKLSGGESVDLYELISPSGLKASILNYGCVLQSLEIPLSDGKVLDAVLGYDTPEGYEKGSSSIGALTGRYAGRIHNAEFVLDHKKIKMTPNEGPNHLHGVIGKRLFHADVDEDRLKLHYCSPDGEDDLPGNLDITVTYQWKDQKTFEWTIEARTDQPTVLNLTNHSYFNLSDEETIENHMLRVNASQILDLREDGIPTGQFICIDDTAFDFRRMKSLGTVLQIKPEDETEQTLQIFRGLDHGFVIDGRDDIKEAADLYAPADHVGMKVMTSQPGMQVYTAGFLQYEKCDTDKNGKKLVQHGGICLETQHFPDSPNQAAFPNTVLRTGETYREVTQLIFYQKNE